MSVRDYFVKEEKWVTKIAQNRKRKDGRTSIQFLCEDNHSV
ncbi:hypothetical protein BREVNS_0646 [Brevinematales bacterium NS]|nr:hypothetical protein BREVNS_0646 [Brevinematales bacterium NS]